jgi:hypothetical protein
MVFSGRDYEMELASLAGSLTPVQLVRHLLDCLPFLDGLPMKERWKRFRREARNRYFRRVMGENHHVPCYDPDPVELAYWLLVSDSRAW